MMNVKKGVVQLMVITMGVFLLSACNTVKGTVQGVGQDIQSVTGQKKSTTNTSSCKNCSSCKKHATTSSN